MSMSKKDFIALADTMRGTYRIAKDGGTGAEKLLMGFIIGDLCQFMKSRNPAFKEDRWRAYLAGECGPNGGKKK